MQWGNWAFFLETICNRFFISLSGIGRKSFLKIFHSWKQTFLTIFLIVLIPSLKLYCRSVNVFPEAKYLYIMEVYKLLKLIYYYININIYQINSIVGNPI
jgi:predicted CDP-diglyceride synthetase/phosphatidate cytidylyltransferase